MTTAQMLKLSLKVENVNYALHFREHRITKRGVVRIAVLGMKNCREMVLANVSVHLRNTPDLTRS